MEPLTDKSEAKVKAISTNGNILTHELARPVSTADRIKSIDIIRGFALLGILLMNIPGFGLDQITYVQVLAGSHMNKDWVAMASMFIFFDGTMRGLFSMLFGAGMILFTMNKKTNLGQPTVAEYYYRRLLWLVAFGLLNAYVLLWVGDILFFYGLGGMILYIFRKSRPGWLLALGFLCVGFGLFNTQMDWNNIRGARAGYLKSVQLEKDKKPLTEKIEEDKANWLRIQKNQAPDTARANENIRQMQGNYPTVFTYLIPQNSSIESYGAYFGMWDMFAMMFVGMALFKWGFFSNKFSSSTYAMLLLLGYSIGIPFGWGYFQNLAGLFTNVGKLVDSYTVPLWSIYDFRRILISVGHASLLMLIYRSKIVPWLMKALSNVGQMAFTNYLMQSIFCSLIFFGYGFGYFGKLRFHQLYYIAGCIWIFQMIFSTIWLKYFRFGPFEWTWRSLTYWKKQPMLVVRSEK